MNDRCYRFNDSALVFDHVDQGSEDVQTKCLMLDAAWSGVYCVWERVGDLGRVWVYPSNHIYHRYRNDRYYDLEKTNEVEHQTRTA